MNKITELFGSYVFSDKVLREKVPSNVYKKYLKVLASDEKLDLETANFIANAMKEWAIEKGATHYTHWFQPMTNITAEKHESFISKVEKDSLVIDFSGKELIKGEPDASSFPSGGLRTTFEARGYTAWDPTSYAFIKDNTLCIPTAFCSYNGLSLDKKTPLLRSIDAINKQSLRLLKVLGDHKTTRVYSSVGVEQEYFLVDEDYYNKRPDLIFCGRTLFGALPPKGQELDDHYFGSIKPKVSKFMAEVEEELWKLGIAAKTKHNEVAPAQHELACIYSNSNISVDHNQLTMEVLKKVASRYHMSCLLHEKPFAGVNGSGKHNNWSLCTDTGVNLLDPGKDPIHNLSFLLFLMATIEAVDTYPELLRISVASAGNDFRLGANEAPPAIISMFLGDELSEVLEAIKDKKDILETQKVKMEIGASNIPAFSKDSTDRNRTSPFAFTGNKFEFRMPGSSFSLACTNQIINTIVAKVISKYADILEKEDDVKAAAYDLIRKAYADHKKVIYNGNNYSQEWLKEAEKRKLPNLKTTVDSLLHYTDKKNVELFTDMKVLSKDEINSRLEILLENYVKTNRIEALTLIDIVNQHVVSAAMKYQKQLLDLASSKEKLLGTEHISVEKALISSLSSYTSNITSKTTLLKQALTNISRYEGLKETACEYKDVIIPLMLEIRSSIDSIEAMMAKDLWPFPTYSDLLYSVK